MKVTIITLILSLLFISCGKEEFASIKQTTTSTAPITLSTSTEVCANHTLVRPYVDFLFLWDNTSSQTFVNEETRSSLANTIKLISDRFDYRVLLAPMIGNDNNHAFILTANQSGLNSESKSMVVDLEDSYSKLLTFPATTKSQETGIERAVQLINYNYERNNGIFRKNAYLVIVLMSNGNDQINTSSGIYNGAATNNYIQNNFNKLIDLSSSSKLNTIYTRFMSLVAHSSCNAGWRIGESYQKFSKMVFNQFIDCDESNNDIQCEQEKPDSHDICGISFSSLFDAVNDSIFETVIKHKYNYWPISFQKDPVNFDLSTLKVLKNNGEEFHEVPADVMTTGWKYIGWKDDHPTTFEPFVGENKSAHFLELTGDARVTYPECLVLEYDSPTYYYGYLTIPYKPLVSSILIKDGDKILDSDQWSYVGYVEEQNLRIQGPNNPDFPFKEFFPSDIASKKYIIKLNENLIYQNDQSDRFTIIYDTVTE